MCAAVVVADALWSVRVIVPVMYTRIRTRAWGKGEGRRKREKDERKRILG